MQQTEDSARRWEVQIVSSVWRPPGPSRRLHALVLAVLLLLLAGCGQGSDDVATANDAARASDTDEQPPRASSTQASDDPSGGEDAGTPAGSDTTADGQGQACESLLACETEIPSGVQQSIGGLTPGPGCVLTVRGGRVTLVFGDSLARGDFVRVCVDGDLPAGDAIAVDVTDSGGARVVSKDVGTAGGFFLAFDVVPAIPLGTYDVVVSVDDLVIGEGEIDVVRASTPRWLVKTRTLRIGDVLDVWFGGFAPGMPVDVHLYRVDGDCEYYTTVPIRIDDNGEATLSVGITSADKPGEYEFFAGSADGLVGVCNVTSPDVIILQQ